MSGLMCLAMALIPVAIYFLNRETNRKIEKFEDEYIRAKLFSDDQHDDFLSADKYGYLKEE